MSLFPRVGRLARGYDVEEVDAFFAGAREAYERVGPVPASPPTAASASAGAQAPTSSPPGGTLDLSAAEVRSATFGLRRRGYDVTRVDAALARLADAVARHERETSIARRGREAYLEELAALARVVARRVRRVPGERVSRATGLHRGYHVGDVDELCDRLKAYFDDGEALAVEDVRGAVFRSRRGRRGYAEASVDALLDRAVAVMVTAPD
ncbi:DivIVA domain-containing protein [Pseudokineococcus sp. 1T1Z-3]|uniref:DivIVA domain-containing protein n=1 Tax=Pseudokineococcus sp. 1T1Z-3 TaxID=3132745 RepID=UPI0030A568D5